MTQKSQQQVNDEFSSESETEIDKMIIHAVISAIEDSNKLWFTEGGIKGNDEIDVTKQNLVSSRRKKSVPVKRAAFISSEGDGNKTSEESKCVSICADKEKNNLEEGEVERKLEDYLNTQHDKKLNEEWLESVEIDQTKTTSEKSKMSMKVKVDENKAESQESLPSKSEDVKTKTKSILLNYKWHCTRCPAIVNTISELRAHHRNAHNEPVAFKCLQCPKVYSRYHSFLRHIKLHSSNKTYDCDICHKSFTQKTVLLAHATVHSNSRPHVCKVCGKAFKQFSSLYCHNKNHLPDKSKFQCTVCDKAYATKHTLELHRKIHTGERNYVCDICGKSFVARGSLDYHILSHTDSKPHVCRTCGKAFKTVRLLEKHATLHTGVKPHHCDFCGKQFREKGALREHTRIHTGAMPYTCEFCGRTFRFKGILTVHRRQHTGERPYGCTDCKKTFTNWANYNKHMKRRHKNEYNPTNVSGRNKYKPPFLIQEKTNTPCNSEVNTYQAEDNSNTSTTEEIGSGLVIELNKPEIEETTKHFITHPVKHVDFQCEQIPQRNYCTEEDLKVMNDANHQDFFGTKEDLKEVFLKVDESLNVFDVGNRRVNFRTSTEEDVFEKSPTTQTYFMSDIHSNGVVYNTSEGLNSKPVNYAQSNNELRLLQDGHNSTQSSNMVYCVPVHYNIPLELNSLFPRIS